MEQRCSRRAAAAVRDGGLLTGSEESGQELCVTAQGQPLLRAEIRLPAPIHRFYPDTVYSQSSAGVAVIP